MDILGTVDRATQRVWLYLGHGTPEAKRLSDELATVTAERDTLAQKVWGLASGNLDLRDAATYEAMRQLSGVKNRLEEAGTEMAQRVYDRLARDIVERNRPMFDIFAQARNQPRGVGVSSQVDVTTHTDHSTGELIVELNVSHMRTHMRLGREAAAIVGRLTQRRERPDRGRADMGYGGVTGAPQRAPTAAEIQALSAVQKLTFPDMKSYMDAWRNGPGKKTLGTYLGLPKGLKSDDT